MLSNLIDKMHVADILSLTSLLHCLNEISCKQLCISNFEDISTMTVHIKYRLLVTYV